MGQVMQQVMCQFPIWHTTALTCGQFPICPLDTLKKLCQNWDLRDLMLLIPLPKFLHYFNVFASNSINTK